MDFPSTLTTIESSFWLRMTTNANRVIILRSETPPTVSTDYYNASKFGVILVPSHLVGTYKAASGWSLAAAKIQPLEGSKYEVFNEWEYD